MKRIIVIEWKGGIFHEMTILNSPQRNDVVFKVVDDGVTLYAERYDVPIERIEVSIYIKYQKD